MSTAFVVNGQTVYQPTAKQLEFHLCPARFPLFGGARGPGKSHAMRWHMHMACMTVPGFHGLLLRRNLLDLRRSHARYMSQEAQQLGATWTPSAGGAGECVYPNGSLLELGHCQHEDNYTIYLSAQYDGQGFDELVTFSEFMYLQIRSSCRTTKPGLLARVLGATNPGVSPINPGVPGLGESWVKRRWIDHDVSLEDDEKYNEADYAYIPARFEDNPHLNQEDYDTILGSLPPEVRRAYREGDWNIFVGQFFPEFRRDWHIQEFEVPAHLPRTCGLDWGFTAEGVCLWGVINADGQLCIEDEYVFNGPKHSKQIALQVAQNIRNRNQERLIRVRATYADPAMFASMGHVGETMAETFASAKVPLVEANNERINGWAKMRAWLRPMPKAELEPAERPWMIIHPRCQYLIRTLPQLVMDKTRPEDVDTDSADHGADALRYLMAGRPSPQHGRARQAFPAGTMGWMKDQILHARKSKSVRSLRAKQYAY